MEGGGQVVDEAEIFDEAGLLTSRVRCCPRGGRAARGQAVAGRADALLGCCDDAAGLILAGSKA